MKVIAITQARFGSSRLPGKVLKTIQGKTLLQIHLDRAFKARKINKLIVATTVEEEADEIAALSTKLGCSSFRGSVNDVLDRFFQATQGENADYVVRLTSDCPLIDPELIDKIVQYTIDKKLDYCSNTLEPKYPDGQDVEVFSLSALNQAWTEAKLTSDREHVTPYIWKNSSYKGGVLFKSDNFDEGYSFGHLRMTIDEQKDFEVINTIIADKGFDCTWLEYALYLDNNQKLKEQNASIGRNEGYDKSISKEIS